MTDPAAVWRGRVQDHLDAAGRPPLGGMLPNTPQDVYDGPAEAVRAPLS